MRADRAPEWFPGPLGRNLGEGLEFRLPDGPYRRAPWTGACGGNNCQPSPVLPSPVLGRRAGGIPARSSQERPWWRPWGVAKPGVYTPGSLQHGVIVPSMYGVAGPWRRGPTWRRIGILEAVCADTPSGGPDPARWAVCLPLSPSAQAPCGDGNAGATCCPWRNRLVGPVGDASLCRSTASSHADRGCLLVDPRGAGCALLRASRRDTSSGAGAVPAATAAHRLWCNEGGHWAARRTPRGRSHPAEFPMSEDEGKQKL